MAILKVTTLMGIEMDKLTTTIITKIDMVMLRITGLKLSTIQVRINFIEMLRERE